MRRHLTNAFERAFRQTREPSGRTFFPGGPVADFRRTLFAGRMAAGAGFIDDGLAAAFLFLSECANRCKCQEQCKGQPGQRAARSGNATAAALECYLLARHWCLL
jgi:hypothetical protein